MDTISLLKAFAKSQNIAEKEVDLFLEPYLNPKTLDELVALPHDMLHHCSYITWLEEPLKSFIRNHMVKDRYETIFLKDVISAIENYRCDLAEDDEEGQAYIENIVNHVVSVKFGSVLYDW